VSPNRKHHDARSRRFATAALLLAACACPSAWAADAPTILPPAPQALQDVTARIALPLCVNVKGVQLVDGVFEIEVGVDEACPSPPPPPKQEASLGRLPAGTYRARSVDRSVPNAPVVSPDVVFTVARAPANASLLDFSGVWWNRARAGEAFFLDHVRPERLFLVWNTFDGSGDAHWFVMQSDQRLGDTLFGDVYEARGPAGTPTLRRVGRAFFSAASSDLGSFVLTPADGGATQSVLLERVGRGGR
jgi:hypothetical protein